MRTIRVSLLFLIVVSLLSACAKPLKSEGISDTPAHHYTVGMKFLETGELGRAEAEFERASRLSPDYAPAYEGLGLAALARKDFSKAEAFLKKSKSKDAKYVPAHLGLAKLYMAKGELDSARDAAERAVDLAPKNAIPRILLGQVHLNAFEFGRAETSFARALELEPTNREARREWDRSVRIRQAAPGTLVGKRIALADPITRGELAALLATELGVEKHVRRRRPELFDASFRPPVPPGPPRSDPPALTDIAQHWARNAIELVMRLNLMEGYPDRTFRPDEPVTRAGLALTLEQVLAVVTNNPRLKTQHVGQQSPFPDVRSDHFAFNAAVIVTTQGLMEAERPSGAFRITRSVSGSEALLAMRKLAELF